MNQNALQTNDVVINLAAHASLSIHKRQKVTRDYLRQRYVTRLSAITPPGGKLINQTWTPVSDKTHIRNYRSQIVTHRAHKSSWILCAIKKKLSKYPGSRPRLPALVSFEYFSCIKIKFLKPRISGQKTHEKRSFHSFSLFPTRCNPSRSNGDDAPLAKTEASFKHFWLSIEAFYFSILTFVSK